jgi:hypothetical protein
MSLTLHDLLASPNAHATLAALLPGRYAPSAGAPLTVHWPPTYRATSKQQWHSSTEPPSNRARASASSSLFPEPPPPRRYAPPIHK